MLNVKLSEDVQDIRNEYARVVNMERRFPHFEDGQIFSNRQIMSALWELSEGTRRAIKSSKLAAEVEDKYHLKSINTIGQAAVNMAIEMYPLIEGVNEEESVQLVIPELMDQYGAMAHRYVHLRFTDLGIKYMKYVHYSDEEYNYNRKHKIPAAIRTLIPYTLLKSNYGLGVGIKADKVPVNARETFHAMALLTADENIDDAELAKVFKGVDLAGDYTILTTTDSLKSLIQEGYYKFTVLCPFRIDRNPKGGRDLYTLTINRVPYGRTINYVKNEFLEIPHETAIQELMIQGLSASDAIQKLFAQGIYTFSSGAKVDFGKKKFTSFTAYSSKPIVKHGVDMEIEFRLHPGYSLKDVEKEILDKTSLKSPYTLEYIGVIHGEGDTIGEVYDSVLSEGHDDDNYKIKTKLIKPENQKLEIMGLREILLQHIKVGIMCRKVHYSNQLKQLEGKIWHAKLLEKVTRPEVAEELATFLNKPLHVKYELAEDLAKRKIPEGLSDEELKVLFKEESNQYLGKLHRYEDARYSIMQFEEKITQIKEAMSDHNIRKEIIDDLLELAQLPAFARRSQVLFERADYLEAKLRSFQPISPSIDTPYPATLAWNRHTTASNLIYGTNILAMGATNQIDFVVGQDIIFGITQYSIEYLDYSQLPLVPSVNISRFNGYPFIGYFTISGENDRVLLVTNSGRARIVRGEDLITQLRGDGIRLRQGETIFKAINITDFGVDFFVDALIVGGPVRRVHSSEIPCDEKITGRLKNLITGTEELKDIAVYKTDRDEISYMTAKGVITANVLPYQLKGGLDVAPYKFKTDLPPEYFINENKFYFKGLQVPAHLIPNIDVEAVYNRKTHYYWNEEVSLNPKLEGFSDVFQGLQRSMRKNLSEMVNEGATYMDYPVTLDDLLLTLTAVSVEQTKAYATFNIETNSSEGDNQLLANDYRFTI